jgi:hypothetical protein
MGLKLSVGEQYSLRGVGLAQLLRFLVVELIHPGLNPRFNIGVIFTANYFSVRGDAPVNNEALLLTDFMNLKIRRLSLSKVLIGVRRACVCS